MCLNVLECSSFLLGWPSERMTIRANDHPDHDSILIIIAIRASGHSDQLSFGTFAIRTISIRTKSICMECKVLKVLEIFSSVENFHCVLCVSINVHFLIIKFLQEQSSDFHSKHNICSILDETYPNIEPFTDVASFLKDNRSCKALTDKHKCYGSHVRFFWNAAHYVEDEKAIHSAVRTKDENNKDVDIPVNIIVNDVRRVLDLKDKDEDSIIGSERLCKGFRLRMGNVGFVNDPTYTKSKFCRPYKFLVHCVIHALGHRKDAYDEASDYIMNIISSMVLNRPYNISQVIFNQMIDNINGDKCVQYPRFVQMLIDDQVQNLPMDDDDELKLDHMDSETLKCLDVYRGVKKENEPKYKQKFAATKKPDYEAPEDDKWRHDNSGSDDKTKRMEPLVLKKTRWWFVKEEKSRKRTPKVTTPKVVKKGEAESKKRKSPPRLVDEPIDLPPKNVDVTVIGEPVTFTVEELLNILEEDDVAKTIENVEAEAGGERLKETFIEGEVHTDSSETKSDIEVTKMTPTSYISGKFKLKKSPKKKKASDEEDATYEPTPAEKEKMKKKGIRKGKHVQP
ncbi:hypothetical protein Hanom_Chr12g01143231 [Helianthus anomalus]